MTYDSRAGRRWRDHTRPRILRRDRYVCHWCGGPADQVDHVIPKARGGADDDANLVASCGHCNRSKGTRRAPKVDRTIRRSVFSRQRVNTSAVDKISPPNVRVTPIVGDYSRKASGDAGR